MKNQKKEIMQAIEVAGREINVEDLEQLQEEFCKHLEEQIEILKKKKQTYIKLENPSGRIVVIGDIHCDYNSLAEIFRKLSISTFDYFQKAIFIFLGDYIDRGERPLETLRLLFRLKEILGERCIFLRGNHDLFKYNEDKKFFSNVKPAETVDLFSEHFEEKTIFKFMNFFDSLPYFMRIVKKEKNILFVHGGIPKEDLMKSFECIYNHEKDKPDKIKPTSNGLLKRLFGKKANGAPEKAKQKCDGNSEEKNILKEKMLFSMLWGDPVNAKFKMNSNSLRFEFGSEQFESFMKKYRFTHLLRGHEPTLYGCKSMYDEKLITVFSSGGKNNEQSYYLDEVPYPAFLIIDEEGNIRPENIYVYKTRIDLGMKKKLLKNGNYLYEKENALPRSFLIDFETNENTKSPKTEDIQHDLFLNDEFAVELRFDFSKLPGFLKKNKQFISDLVQNMLQKK